MSERFIKFIPSEESFWLMEHKPNAFRLLTHIANTARRTPGSPDGILIGQCHLKASSKYGFTEREYRTAKEILVARGHIKIVITNRTRQKSTTETTTKTTTDSTIVELISSTVYDINQETTDNRNDDKNDNRPTTDRQLTDNKQEGKEDKEREEKKKRSAQIFFNRLTFAFEGIEESLMKIWREAYPLLSMEKEFSKMKEWLLRPENKDRTGTRAFIAKWLDRARPEETKNQNGSNEKHFRNAKPTPPGNTPGNETKFEAARILRVNPIVETNPGDTHG